jgi:hypothetical protein
MEMTIAKEPKQRFWMQMMCERRCNKEMFYLLQTHTKIYKEGGYL